MTDIFLSFSSADQDEAVAVTNHLERDGQWTVWRCTRFEDNLPAGNWVRELAERLTEARLVLCLLSEHSAASDYVLKEITMAIGLRKVVLVVRLDDSPLPLELDYLLRSVQTMSASGTRREDWMARMRVALLRHLGNQPFRGAIDSVGNRALKVEVCQHVHARWFGGRECEMSGICLRVLDLESHYARNPELAGSVWSAVNSRTYAITSVPPDAATPLVLSFLAKEGVLFVVAIRTGDQGSAELPGIFESLFQQVYGDLVERGLDGEFRVECSKGRTVTLIDPSDREVVARYLTRLGKEGSAAALSAASGEASIPPAWLGDRDRVRMNELHRLVRRPSQRWHALTPRELTAEAAYRFMNALLSQP